MAEKYFMTPNLRWIKRNMFFKMGQESHGESWIRILSSEVNDKKIFTKFIFLLYQKIELCKLNQMDFLYKKKVAY